MAETSLSGTADEVQPTPYQGPAFGPVSLGRVAPPSLAQMVHRARARLSERERLAARLLSIAGVLFSLPFAIDLMGFTGVIQAQSRLSTSPLLRGALVDWSVALVDGAVVLVELLLMAACFLGAARFAAARPKGAWILSVVGAAGSIVWLPVLWGAAVEVFPQDAMSAILASIFPGLGFLGCALMVAGGLVGRLRPVRPYERR